MGVLAGIMRSGCCCTSSHTSCLFQQGVTLEHLRKLCQRVQRFRDAVSATPFSQRLEMSLAAKSSKLRELRNRYYKPDDSVVKQRRQRNREVVQELAAQHMGESAALPEDDAECDAAVERIAQDSSVRDC